MLRDKIIESAKELFLTQGYEKTRIDTIIEKAGCSKGGFYHLFKSKDQLLLTVVNDSLVATEMTLSRNGEYILVDRFNYVFHALCNDNTVKLYINTQYDYKIHQLLEKKLYRIV